jgi:hypothetical protein
MTNIRRSFGNARANTNVITVMLIATAKRKVIAVKKLA